MEREGWRVGEGGGEGERGKEGETERGGRDNLDIVLASLSHERNL